MQICLEPKYRWVNLSKQVNIHLNILKVLISIAFPNETQSIFVSLVHHYFMKHLPDISHNAEFTLTKPE